MEPVKKKGTNRKWVFLALGLLLCGSLLGATGVLIASENRYSHPSQVADIDISDLTYEEALLHLEQTLDWENRQLNVMTTLGDFTFSYSQLGLSPDLVGTLENYEPTSRWRPSPRHLPLKITLDEEKFNQVYEELRGMVYQDPISAEISFSGGEVDITPHVLGVTVDPDEFRDAVWKGSRWETLPENTTLVLEILHPATSTEDLVALGLQRIIGQFTTRFSTSNVSRSKNIEIATSYIHDVLLEPGEVFSFNEVVGPRTADRGYELANVFFGHEVRLGIGGGVCQVSTTLYNAVVMANLEIVQRSSHSMTVDYVKIGLDAAIHYTAGQDLRFRNDTGAHLLIKGEVTDGLLTFSMYGTAPEDLQVKTLSEVVETFPYETKIIEDPELPEGEQVVTGGVQGRRVTAKAIVFINGEEQIRPLPSSYYIPIPKEIRIGTMPVEDDVDVIAETTEEENPQLE